MAQPFLDTNILLRHLRQDDQALSPKATAIIVRIERGELPVRTSDAVIFETVFTLQRTYCQPKDAIADALLAIIELPGILLPNKRSYRRVFDLYRTTRLGFADCYHVALMERLRLSEILSFDTDFDSVPTIQRRES
jgi:predicted nucleic acid-binding protein